METQNETKAKEIAENIVGNNHYSYFDDFKQCALEAMEWKEKEIKDRLTNVLYDHSLNGIIESVKNRHFISLDEFTDFIVKGE